MYHKDAVKGMLTGTSRSNAGQSCQPAEEAEDSGSEVIWLLDAPALR